MLLSRMRADVICAVSFGQHLWFVFAFVFHFLDWLLLPFVQHVHVLRSIMQYVMCALFHAMFVFTMHMFHACCNHPPWYAWWSALVTIVRIGVKVFGWRDLLWTHAWHMGMIGGDRSWLRSRLPWVSWSSPNLISRLLWSVIVLGVAKFTLSYCTLCKMHAGLFQV